MENRPTLRVFAWNIQPEYEKRLLNWCLEVYFPLCLTAPGFTGIDFYGAATGAPDYPKYVELLRYFTRQDMLKVRNTSQTIDVFKDVGTQLGRFDFIWAPAYELLRRFTSQESGLVDYAIPNANKAPFICLESYDISAAQQEVYEDWVGKWGYEVYLPLLLRLPGLMTYECYRLIDVPITGPATVFLPKKPVEYPRYISILHFADENAYRDYANSAALAAYRDHMRLPFPDGLHYHWYSQYQLVKSFRK